MKRLIFSLLSALLLSGYMVCAQPAAGWFPFSPGEKFFPAEIDMTSWLDAPAGKHGFVQRKDDKLIFEDGTRVKFWGTNICSNQPFVEHAVADKWVDFLAKYGINSVRFHKFTYHVLTPEYSTQLIPEKMDNFDYFHNRLREKGIYYGWSPVYGHKPRPGDKSRLLAYDEIMQFRRGSHLDTSTIGLVNFAEDLQKLHIELLVRLLTHQNPYSGLRYADDPALAFIEIQNEDNIWFATADQQLENSPSYANLLTARFTLWLRDKYTNQEGLLKAWGQEAFDWGREVRKTDWNLDQGNIRPVAHHGIYDYEFQKYLAQGQPMPLFLLDMARFLFELQLDFYKKTELAIRQTGYKGAIVGSCWQAGSGPTHYYNLFADAEMGLVDRHNYFGGGTGHRLVPGKMKNHAMVQKPGSGLLSTGFQQVIDKPFSFSEWMSLPPNEWIAEASPIIAFYGLGLQGWDASYSFATDNQNFTSTIHTPGVYNATSPTQMVLYPAIWAALNHGDIREGELISERNVSIRALAEGKIGFNDKVEQEWDEKVFRGDLPAEALAIGRIGVTFTDEFRPTEMPDLSAYIDSVSQTVTSTTGQLKWHYGGKPYFTLNAPCTRAFVGFLPGNDVALGNLSLRFTGKNPFAVVLITSLEKGTSLDSCQKVLVTVMGRAMNTGQKFNEDKTQLLDVGTAPILLEPVPLEIAIANRGVEAFFSLDHAGANKKPLTFSPNKLVCPANAKTMYYLINLKKP